MKRLASLSYLENNTRLYYIPLCYSPQKIEKFVKSFINFDNTRLNDFALYKDESFNIKSENRLASFQDMATKETTSGESSTLMHF